MAFKLFVKSQLTGKYIFVKSFRTEEQAIIYRNMNYLGFLAKIEER